MTDQALMADIRADLEHMRNRGFPRTALNIADLMKRFENLLTCHKMLAEREERLTQELVSLRP